MPAFRYRAVTATAETIEGRMDAADRPALVDYLHALGHVPIRIEELSTSPIESWLAGGLLPTRRIKPRSLALITAQLATLLRAGLPLDEALDILTELVDGAAEKKCIRGLIEKISRGSSLSDAMLAQQGVFPKYCIGVVQAGEAGGSLDAALERLADFIERSAEMRSYIVSALIYPIVVALACIASIAVVLLFVVPRFRPLFEQTGEAMPITTRAVVALSDVLAQYWWLHLLSLFLIGIVAYLYLKNPVNRILWRGRFTKLPLLGELLRKVEVAQFGRTLGTLLKNGVPLLTALAVTRDTMVNASLAEAVGRIIELAKTGKGLAQPMRETHAFPTLAVHLVRIGEENGRHDDMLIKVAEVFEAETRRNLDRLLALVAPAVTIVLGVIVAGIFVSLMTALLSVYDLTM